MEAYELSVEVTEQGELELPYALREVLPRGQVVRVEILADRPERAVEQEAWPRLTAEQFLSGYGENETIYDRVRARTTAGQ